jgi:hypothetical protein
MAAASDRVVTVFAVSFGIFVCRVCTFVWRQGIQTTVRRYSLQMIRSFDR